MTFLSLQGMEKHLEPEMELVIKGTTDESKTYIFLSSFFKYILSLKV